MKELHAYFDRVVRSLAIGDTPPPPGDVLRSIEGLCGQLPRRRESPARDGKLSIALCCREYPPDTAFGGMATFTAHLAHGLVDAGHRVTVFTVGRPRHYTDFNGQADIVRILPRFRSESPPFEELLRAGRLSWARNVFFYSLGLYKQIEEVERECGAFDVLDLADHAAEGVIPALFWHGPKTVRLYSPWSVLRAMRAGFLWPDEDESLYALERAAICGADLVTSPSRELAARVQTFFALQKPIHFVPNPIDTELFCPVPGKERSTALRVLYVGRLEERKGIRTLFDAIPQVLKRRDDVMFHIVGRDALGIGVEARYRFDPARVRFLEQVSLTALPRLYQESDIAVVPSNYDNSPYTALEPMACGIPVVAAATGGIPEYVSHNESGLIVAPRDSAALAEAIARLAENVNERIQMGLRGRALARASYDCRRVAAIMTGLYRHLLSAERREHTEICAGAITDTLDRQRPEANRVEALVVAAKGDAAMVARTVNSLRRQSKILATVTIVWGGDAAIEAEGCAVATIKGTPALECARLFSTVLTDLFFCIEAGREAAPGFVDRLLWRFLAWEGVGCVYLEGMYGFRASAVRGFQYLDRTHDWAEVLRGLQRSLRSRSWREAGEIAATVDELPRSTPSAARPPGVIARPSAIVTPLVRLLRPSRSSLRRVRVMRLIRRRLAPFVLRMPGMRPFGIRLLNEWIRQSSGVGFQRQEARSRRVILVGAAPHFVRDAPAVMRPDQIESSDEVWDLRDLVTKSCHAGVIDYLYRSGCTVGFADPTV